MTPKDAIQGGVNNAAGGTGPNPEATLQTTITGIVDLLTFIVGAVAVIMIIYAGYKYITSGGDPGKIASAKTAIVYAVIGIAVVAIAQVITRFVIDYLI